jgi:DtxR family transcriptional regulator, Mn-dependent transcriptional regulator
VTLTQSAEDYLLAIYRLQGETDGARVKDVADMLGVKKPSVVTQVQRLKDEGVVEHAPYGRIELTAKGRDLGRELLRKNRVVYHFLHDVLGVERQVAESEACGIEHHLHHETFSRFVEFMTQNSQVQEALDADADLRIELFTLYELDVGTCATVARLGGDDETRARCMAAGFKPGHRVRLLNVALDGQALDLQVSGRVQIVPRDLAAHVIMDADSVDQAGSSAHCVDL